MCNSTSFVFTAEHLTADRFRGRSVLEVGARDVNGSLRSFIETRDPRSYVGIDIRSGPGVDEICAIESLVETFGDGAFDVVICTEVIEHVSEWRAAISNLKRVTAPGGWLLVTTRSRGFPYHAYPDDFWRFEMDDMRTLFSDMTIDALKSDPEEPGVFLLASRPDGFDEADLDGVALYSMHTGVRTPDIAGAWSGSGLRYRVLRTGQFFRPVLRVLIPRGLRVRLHRRIW